MKNIARLIQKDIEKRLFSGKVIILYGARQVGKTTLVKQIISKNPGESLYLNCETLAVSQALSVPEPKRLKNYFNGKILIVLDEAQKIKDVGLILKILVDTYPELQIIATGSSSFELANETSEALTGRAYRFTLYPLSLPEIEKEEGRLGVEAGLENLLRFGSYPGVYSLPDNEAINRLNEISSNYLYKDVLSFGGLKKLEIITDLLQMLALQVGSEVSYHEIATRLGVSRITVKKYIDILSITKLIHATIKASRKGRFYQHQISS
ncbi:MAG TPA: ATP-binding protein [Candidatus Kaiserbacteria bacterium]|nr:ATP-binding protein [Candidatus Kaiserbacteria bacterium]